MMFFMCNIVEAQIHIRKLKGVELSVGSSINRIYSGNIAGSYFLNKKYYVKMLFGYEKGEDVKYDSVDVVKEKIYFETYNIEPSLYRTLYNKKRLYVNMGTGLSIIYNNVENVKYTHNQDGIFFGGFIGLENELYLSKKIALICGVKQYFYLNRDIVNVGRYRCLLNVGVKKTF